MSSDLNELHSNTNLLHLPCFAPVGTRIFAPTADQRFLAGSDEFLRTHFPMRLHSYNAGRSTLYTEQEILNCLLNPSPSVIGNRVFVLYGAAGSGKSELMRWLQTHISFQDQFRADVTMRISRTELDIFHIAQRLQQLHNSSSFQSTTAKRCQGMHLAVPRLARNSCAAPLLKAEKCSLKGHTPVAHEKDTS